MRYADIYTGIYWNILRCTCTCRQHWSWGWGDRKALEVSITTVGFHQHQAVGVSVCAWRNGREGREGEGREEKGREEKGREGEGRERRRGEREREERRREERRREKEGRGTIYSHIQATLQDLSAIPNLSQDTLCDLCTCDLVKPVTRPAERRLEQYTIYSLVPPVDHHYSTKCLCELTISSCRNQPTLFVGGGGGR